MLKINYDSKWWNFQLRSAFVVLYFLDTRFSFVQQIMSFPCVRLSVTYQTNLYTNEWSTTFLVFLHKFKTS